MDLREFSNTELEKELQWRKKVVSDLEKRPIGVSVYKQYTGRWWRIVIRSRDFKDFQMYYCFARDQDDAVRKVTAGQLNTSSKRVGIYVPCGADLQFIESFLRNPTEVGMSVSVLESNDPNAMSWLR